MAMSMPSSVPRIQWAPHSNEQFIRINTRNNELGLYQVTELVSFKNQAKIVKMELKGNKLRYELLAKQGKIPEIRCFDWSSVEEDLIAIGQSSGDTLLLRIRERGVNSSFTLSAKSQRSCNSVAFSRENLLATGLHRVRYDSSLIIWDINQRLGSTDPSRSQPSRKINTDTIFSTRFFDDQPNLLVAGVGGKHVRIWDLRDSTGNPVFQAQTKCVYGLTIDKDSNCFATYSEDPVGAVSVWDRRGVGRGPQGWADPVLYFGKATVDEDGGGGMVSCLKYSSQRSGVLAVLNTSGVLRVYETAKLPDPTDNSATSAPSGVAGSVFGGGDYKKGFMIGRDSASVGSSGAGKTGETIYMSKITDVAIPMRPAGKPDKRVSSFDWINTGSGENNSGDLKVVCLKNDGELQVLRLPGTSIAAAISSRNVAVATRGTELIILPDNSRSSTEQLQPTVDAQPVAEQRIMPRRRASETIEEYNGHHAQHAVGSPKTGDATRLGRERHDSLMGLAEAGGYAFPPEEVLLNDICVVMRTRVQKGYGMDPVRNLDLVKDIEYLREMWAWLADAVYRADNGGMTAHYLDFNYVGVKQILNGEIEGRYTKGSFRSKEHQMKEVSAACEELRKRLNKDDFIGTTAYHARRSLALVVCGWHFNRSNLESHLVALEKNGEFAKAAGWALFHNDIPRCIHSLSLGGERMKLMSTAVAGYFAHLSSNAEGAGGGGSNVWKDLCRSMSIELGDPYLRAIFAYVSNGDWIDVLDDVGLPIKERLGIAIRFLKDEDLANYVLELERRVVIEGDLEGIVVTGVGEKFLELLGGYVDRTSDVQTAACVASFVVPRYLPDEVGQVSGWVESYRELLNAWGKWKARGRFDVARGRRARRPVVGGGGYSGMGPGGPNMQGGGIAGVEVQRQIAVRCNTCDRIVSQQTSPSRIQHYPQPHRKSSSATAIAIVATGPHPTSASTSTSPVPHQTHISYPLHPLSLPSKVPSPPATDNNNILNQNLNVPTSPLPMHQGEQSPTPATITAPPPPPPPPPAPPPPPPPTSSLLHQKSTVCPSCWKPLPRCAICLLPLGTVNYKFLGKHSGGAGAGAGGVGAADGGGARGGGTRSAARDMREDYDKWMSWCLKCGHGVHVGHGREWWGGGEESAGIGDDGKAKKLARRKRMCPVPECECLCNAF